MKTADSAMLCNTHPVVSELNRVKGFDPLRFIKNTPEGPKLELKYKKIWFRLKYPQGRFKYSALKITDQLAIIEARVYFDKNDAEPRATFTARCDKCTAPGGMYIEAAQYAAIDQALTDAGFGLQFTQDSSPPKAPEQKKVVSRELVSVAGKAAENAAAQPTGTAAKENASVETQETPKSVTAVESVAPAILTEDVQEVVSVSAPGEYTNEMPVDVICARMTLEEAENYIVPLGTCNGQTMKQVAERRPASLRYYISGYTGDNNILRAAALLVSKSRSLKAS